jgi:hypothetical protein
MSYQYQIPPAVWEGLQMYLSSGVPTGGFLKAVITNNLTEAIGRADEYSLAALPVIVQYLYNEAPYGSWGSPERYTRWIETKTKERELVHQPE